jgi:hypothetical protein
MIFIYTYINKMKYKDKIDKIDKMENKIYIKNRLIISSKENNWLYKYTYNPHLVNFHQENSDYDGNLTFQKQFDDLSIQFYNTFIKNKLALHNELNDVDQYTFFGCTSDALHVDFAYYENKLTYQFVTETSYPENWYQFIKSKYPHLDFSLEYIIENEIEKDKMNEKFCFCFTQSESDYIYKNLNNTHKSYIKIN